MGQLSFSISPPNTNMVFFFNVYDYGKNLTIFFFFFLNLNSLASKAGIRYPRPPPTTRNNQGKVKRNNKSMDCANKKFQVVSSSRKIIMIPKSRGKQ